MTLEALSKDGCSVRHDHKRAVVDLSYYVASLRKKLGTHNDHQYVILFSAVSTVTVEEGRADVNLAQQPFRYILIA